jgi:hypothetical protein
VIVLIRIVDSKTILLQVPRSIAWYRTAQASMKGLIMRVSLAVQFIRPPASSLISCQAAVASAENSPTLLSAATGATSKGNSSEPCSRASKRKSIRSTNGRETVPYPHETRGAACLQVALCKGATAVDIGERGAEVPVG